MKYRRLIPLVTILALLALLAVWLWPGATHPAAEAAVKPGGAPPPGSGDVQIPGFVRVIDGETIDTLINGQQVGVGFIGISAPQANTPCGQAATALLRTLVKGGVNLEEEPALTTDPPTDARKRRLYHGNARDGRKIAEELVKAGVARANGAGKYANQLAGLEIAARAAGRGCLWGGVGAAGPATATGGAPAVRPLSVAMPQQAAQVAVAAAAATALPSGFYQDLAAGGLTQPTSFAQLPDGRVLIAEKAGTVRILKGGTLLPTPFIDFRSQVNDYWDHGLIGIAADKDFAQNGYVYLLYTYENDATQYNGAKTARLSRVTASGDTANPATAMTLLGATVGSTCDTTPAGTDCLSSDSPSHSVGAVRTAADGTLYVAVGDGASFNYVDDDALRAQSLDRLNGKLLHITTGGAGVPGNPFWTGNAADNRSKVWAYGLRNPYRFNLRPGTNLPFLGDVGWDTWEEQNVGVAGANFGWPCYEGNAIQSGYQPKATCQALYGQGTGAMRAPLIVWNHNGASSASTGGAFSTGTTFPAAFQGAYFYADYAANWIRYAKVDANNALVGGPTDFAAAADGPVDLQAGPDGTLLYLAINTGELRRIRYDASNLALGKPATADSACAATEDAPKADDGQTSNNSKWCSQGATKWWQVDLGTVTPVGQFTIRHAGAGGEDPGFNTRDFTIGVSQDGTNWTTVTTVTGNTSSVTTHTIAAVQARYVRLNITTPTSTGDGAARIYEVEVRAPASGTVPTPVPTATAGTGTNLALNKPTTADSACGAGETAPKADDGTLANNSKWCSVGATKWWQVDLGTASAIGQVVVKHAGAGGEDPGWNTRDFTLQVSGDATSWTTVATVTGNTANITTHPFATVTARYVRLNIATPTSTGDAAARIYEVEVYAPQSGGAPPTAAISSPTSEVAYQVGDVIAFAGAATDASGAAIPASGLAWQIIIHHCPGGTCHTHYFQNVSGTSGSFTVPDHGDDSYFELILTATDGAGRQGTASVSIHPRTVRLTLASAPSGLQVVYGGTTYTTPATFTADIGGTRTVSVPAPQTLGGTTYTFGSWSDGGAQQHNITIGAADATLTATLAAPAAPIATPTATATPTPSAPGASRYAAAVLGTGGLQDYYRLDETSGTTVRDSKGTRNGTIQGGVTLGVPGALAGDLDPAMRFDGTGYVDVPGGAAGLVGGAMTLETWAILPNAPPAHGSLVGIRNDADADFYILMLGNSNKLECRFRNGAGAQFDLNPTITPDAWHHLALVYDGSATLTLYVDGAVAASTPASGRIANATPSLRVGKDVNNNGLATTVDEVAVYNVALTATQVADHYNAGKGTAATGPPPTPAPPTPTAPPAANPTPTPVPPTPTPIPPTATPAPPTPTSAPAVGPVAPGGLAASRNGLATNQRVALTWVDNATNEASYVVERATAADFTGTVASFRLAANATSYTDTSVRAATTYYYRVVAIGPSGARSTPSNVASIATR